MIKIIHNVETGEITEVELTLEDIADKERLVAQEQARKIQQDNAEAKRLAAFAKLEALGLDEADLKALGL